ncbi:NADPH-dependent F420 reductase [Leifsonia poae]|uniref:Oxidoreductase n=1 Tax=Leifsonia poae TaxID=110933 RepID=A0A9W6H791_9MICO|nr:NAD(P)-binding domain-containing protein [Leifsonia poae]GLJ75245.1 oxidoreductase [Leifsonia poae]
MKIAIIGTGRVGRTLSAGFATAGHEVVLGSRDPDDRGDAPAPILPAADAVDGADIVVDAIPGNVAVPNLRELGRSALDGTILIDVGNALDERYGLVYPNASLGAALQAEFRHTRVVKTLNTVSAPLMTRPKDLPPTTVFLSGDDAEAKAIVGGLLGDLGWSAENRIDLGGIDTAHGPELYVFLSMEIMRAVGTPLYGISVVSGPRPVT